VKNKSLSFLSAPATTSARQTEPTARRAANGKSLNAQTNAIQPQRGRRDQKRFPSFTDPHHNPIFIAFSTALCHF
jgi:hypothetical protein